jgi:tetratricopeptide (TPR) repeat protein
MKKGSLLTGLVLLSLVSAAQHSILPDSVTHLVEQQPRDSSLVIHLNEIAFGYLKSHPILARELADQATSIASEINFTRGYARGVNVKGSSYWMVGDYEAALEFYHESAKASSSINDNVGLSEAYHNIGEVHKELGDYRKAIRYLETSLEWDRLNNVAHAITLYNIGEAYFERDEYPEAASFFEKALKQAAVEHDSRATSYAYHGLGRMRNQEGEYRQALSYYQRAEDLWRTGGELRSLIQLHHDQSDTYLALTDTATALTFLENATSLAQEIQAIDLEAKTYDRVSRIYYGLGEYKKSSDFLRKHRSLRDSVYDMSRSQQIAQLQVAFEKDARLIENQQLKAARALQEAKIRTQGFMIIAISGILVLTGFLAVVFFRQRKKIQVTNALLHEKTEEIHRQKEEIVCQAEKMISLNQQLQDLNKSLEGRIEERTHELWWKNQKLADYAHTNSHKLRAPVASILGLIQLLERVSLPADDMLLLEKLRICAADLDRITREINQRLEEDPELAETPPVRFHA